MVSKYIPHKLLFVTKRKILTLQYRSWQTSPEPMIKGNVAKNRTNGQQVPPDTMLWELGITCGVFVPKGVTEL